jgi:hypothetical protein
LLELPDGIPEVNYRHLPVLLSISTLVSALLYTGGVNWVLAVPRAGAALHPCVEGCDEVEPVRREVQHVAHAYHHLRGARVVKLLVLRRVNERMNDRTCADTGTWVQSNT